MTRFRPLAIFVAVHLAMAGCFWWVAYNYTHLLGRIGNHIENLPTQTRGPLLFAGWVADRWPLWLTIFIVIAFLYGLALAAPEGRRPKPGVVLLCWLPLVFAYGVLLWLTFAQRVPLDMLQQAIGGKAVSPDMEAPPIVKRTPPTKTPPTPEPRTPPAPEAKTPPAPEQAQGSRNGQ